MFGGQKFSKISELLKSTHDIKANNNGSSSFREIASVNDSLFLKIEDAEHYTKQIIKDGQSRYVEGIKQNVIEIVHRWLEGDDSNIFTLYGRMGCGKSFFSARLYQDVLQSEDRYHVVAFSSQQRYHDTISVRNMLLSVAHQLFVGVPACRKYLTDHHLDSESIASLTEGVLISPFGGVTPQKPILIIIDGLDEYPEDDCVTFLETLGKLYSRIHPMVKIFFTSRPETYIMSEMDNESEYSCYHIERNETQSYVDCMRFVDAKCQNANVLIEDHLKHRLVEKSECSLKYLDCVFNDIACNAIRVTADFIESLPSGLPQYYRNQLVRYFNDEKLTFYQTKIVPLLELLCVVLRPITICEAADILGCKESDINNIISHSGTLLWKNNQYVMLYQSESIREFLTDERCCPERYRIDSENGITCILSRLQELMDEGEDIESNMYLFYCAVEHILDKERISREDWLLLVNMIGNYSHKAHVIYKLSTRLLEKSAREIQTFFQHLLAGNNCVDELQQDAFCVRIISSAIDEKMTDKFFFVLDSLFPTDAYDFLIDYGRGRCLRRLGRYDEAVQAFQPHLVLADDADLRTQCRYTYYIDEMCRIYRRNGSISWEENTRLHVQTIQISEHIGRQYQHKNLSSYLVMQRNVSVSYNQLAHLCESLAEQTDGQLRESCAQILRTVLSLHETDTQKSGFFLQAAAVCYEESLRLSKLCQQYDSFSDSRIYDLHYAFYALGNLYANKDFPSYQPEKAALYYKDCLSSIMDIAMRPESHEKYIRVPIMVYDSLVEMYMDEQQLTTASEWLEKGIQMRELYMLYHPDCQAEFERCYGAELMAKMILKDKGIDTAESYYLDAVERYEVCCKKYSDEYVQRAPGVVYHNVACAFKDAKNTKKRIEYVRLELEEIKKMYRLFPSDKWLWDLGVTQETLALALSASDDESTLEERTELLENAIDIYKRLETANPDVPRYQTACAFPYYYIFYEYCRSNHFDKARGVMESYLELFLRVAKDNPKYRNLFDMPVCQYLILKDHIPDLQGDNRIFDACKAYLQEIDPLTDEYDFEKVKYQFMVYEAQRFSKARGIVESEQLYLDAAKVIRSFAEQCKKEEIWYLVANCYTNLYLGYRQKRSNDKAMEYVQQALQELDYAIESLDNATDLCKMQCVLYGMMAEDLKNSSDIELVSAASDLYLLQFNQYIRLYQETNDDTLLERIEDAYSKLQSFVAIQETVVKLAHKNNSYPVETLRSYINIIIHVYSNLFDSEAVQEKLNYYRMMLEELDDA